ncbi:GH92 family glycosyl hydrolase [Haoranjiania flava]|uniref:GH92 family glycosyl hydrolase n=1 Tax=Haoranjiania flava TaxID=1856322 RepID=A0AAE3LKF3_9BACT|nr:GH92 family glycosyl hydrolase [Haoranjiania flava]MCU7694543.1 GH92 family glycosyl hydrolase [Haoranjiania flava]
MKKIFFIAICLPYTFTMAQQKNNSLIKYINPLIGTERMGHTYPGPTVPFGSVQLSPETDTVPMQVNGEYNKRVYEYCAGYKYEDKTIVGFAHTHFNGTGHADLGDFLVMPTAGKLQLNPGTADNPCSGYRSAFSHSNEVAEANYYKVKLDDHNITAELTTTERVGVHQYTFPKSEEAHIILDMMYNIYNYDGKNVWTYIRVENDHTITGYRQTNGWAKNRKVFFAARFSKPFKNYGYKSYARNETYTGFWRRFDIYNNFPEMAGHEIRAFFDFDTESNEKIVVKFALSPVSTEGAMRNLEKEAPGWNFNKIKNEGQRKWQKELEKITVEMLSEEDKINFYTAVYHAFINPTIYQDVDGKYMGLDQNIHEAKDFNNYTTFSLWDTYRALHPLLTILQPSRANDMIKSMLAHYDQSVHKMLPVWSHYANENWCMTGYHSVSVLSDAVVKGMNTFDAKRALEACVATANNRYYDNIANYKKYGYIPDENSGTSVSTTLEYAYDDWCIAQMAKKIGNTKVYNEFIKRSESYKNVFDTSIGFMRPKSANGRFRQQFDPLQTHGEGFIEGNSWNFSFFVPHAPSELIKLMGGNNKFVEKLDQLFTMHLDDKYFANTEDISREGLIGNYNHGNEPAHHVAYLYNFTNQPWKTQEKVRMIIKSQYNNGPDGLGGNDDCGQMSAWYLFSAFGFYPVAPGSDQYALGSPLIKSAHIKLEHGKSLKIIAHNQSEQNVYVAKVLLNGKKLQTPFIKHADLANGGRLEYFMQEKPGKN